MRDRIKKMLENEFPEIDFELSDELIDDGIIDSLTLTGILALISMEFGIMLPFEEIIPDNFNSLDAMTELLSKYVK